MITLTNCIRGVRRLTRQEIPTKKKMKSVFPHYKSPEESSRSSEFLRVKRDHLSLKKFFFSTLNSILKCIISLKSYAGNDIMWNKPYIFDGLTRKYDVTMPKK